MIMSERLYNPTYKIVLLGMEGVGKSCLAERFVHNYFCSNNQSTVGASFLTKNININGETIKLEIWDTAGQERYHALAPMYYRNAQGALIVYDVTNEESYEHAERWIKELKDYCGSSCPPPIYLVGNKVDLTDLQKVFNYHVQNLVQKYGISAVETSAKSGHYINEVFHMLAEKMVSKKQVDNKIRLNLEQNPQSNSYCCS